MTSTGPIGADLDPADREMLVARVMAAARETRQDATPRHRLLAGALAGLALVAGVAIAAVLLSARLPGPTDHVPVVGAPSATAPASPYPNPSGSPAAPPSPNSTTWDFGGMSFSTPAGWNFVTAHRWTAPVGPMAFLANAPIADPCSTEFLPGGACWKPLDALPADGVLVTFSGSAVLTTREMWGKVTTGPADARCAPLGGEEQMRAVFGGFGVSACLRGPDLAAGEAAVRQIVASLLASATSR